VVLLCFCCCYYYHYYYYYYYYHYHQHYHQHYYYYHYRPTHDSIFKSVPRIDATNIDFLGMVFQNPKNVGMIKRQIAALTLALFPGGL